MSVLSYVLIAVGVVVASIATAPLWVYIMSRPRVRFAKDPVAHWSFSEAGQGQRRSLYVGIDVTFQNDGNEESNVSDLTLEIGPDPILRHKGSLEKVTREEVESFVAAQITVPADNGLIERNGGRLTQKLIFFIAEPMPFKRRRHSRRLSRRFYEDDDIFGILRVIPGQNKRLLWGTEVIRADVPIEWLDWTAMRQWLGDSWMEQPTLEPATNSDEPQPSLPLD